MIEIAVRIEKGKMNYNKEFVIEAKYIRFNHCSIRIQHKLYSKENIPVLTIERHSLQEVNPKLIFNFKKPEIFSPKIKESVEFKPDISIVMPFASQKVIRLNNLVFVTIRDSSGNIIEKKIEKKGTERGKVAKSYLTNAQLIIDKANKRIRLSGKKTSPEWVKVGKI